MTHPLKIPEVRLALADFRFADFRIVDWCTDLCRGSDGLTGICRSARSRELFNDYFSNERAGWLNNGQAVLLRSTTRPVYKPEFFNPSLVAQTQPGTVASKDAPLGIHWKTQKRMLELDYSVNFGNMPEHTYQAAKVYIDGSHKRLDSNDTPLTAEAFAKSNGKPPRFPDMPLSENYDDGKTITFLMIHGEMDERDPQAVLMGNGLNLDVPEIRYFGRPEVKRDQGAQLVALFNGYKITGQSTGEGYLVVAESDQKELRKVELLFDPDHDFAVNRERFFNDRIMTQERCFDDYDQTPSGARFPKSIITRKFCPLPEAKGAVQAGNAAPHELVTFEERITVIQADYNIKFPDGMFTPHFPPGTTVCDNRVSPPIQYKTPKDAKATATQPGK